MTIERQPSGPTPPILSIDAVLGRVLVAQTPATGYLLPITDDVGGLLGLTLTGQSGPPFTVSVSQDGGTTWADLTYPHVCAAGETLRVIRGDSSAELGIIQVGESAPAEAGGGTVTVVNAAQANPFNNNQVLSLAQASNGAYNGFGGVVHAFDTDGKSLPLVRLGYIQPPFHQVIF